ncbi:CD1375 family protein [Stecheria intestinalis]|nr:CD1375 family protein [Stecheria intestinalis]
MGYIYARIIRRGAKTLEDVPEKYQEATKAAYFELFGLELE